MVSFSGIDGAGKSTQIETLRSRVQEAGLRVMLITFWDDVARLTRLREVTGHTLFRGTKVLELRTHRSSGETKTSVRG